MKVLIVEDNPSVRRILKTIVAPLTNDIRECDNGEEAIVIYRVEKPDFVLMDINLGETNGIEISRRIKALDAHAQIIIVTSYDETDLRQEAAQAGAVAFVPKDDLSQLSLWLKRH